jgi:hypothetical protein
VGPAQNPSPFLSLGPPFPPSPRVGRAPVQIFLNPAPLSSLSFPAAQCAPGPSPSPLLPFSPTWAVPAQRTHPLRPSARTAPSLSSRAQRSFLSLMNRARLSSLSSRTPFPQRPRRCTAEIPGSSPPQPHPRSLALLFLCPTPPLGHPFPPAPPQTNPRRTVALPPLGAELRRRGHAAPLRSCSDRTPQELHPSTRNLSASAFFDSGPRGERISTELAAGPVSLHVRSIPASVSHLSALPLRCSGCSDPLRARGPGAQPSRHSAAAHTVELPR